MNTRQPQSGPTDRDGRRRERPAVSMNGSVLRAGGISRPIEVIDLDNGGCGIRTPIELELGEAVKITVLGRGSIEAQVRWCKDGRAGLQFEPVVEELAAHVERSAPRKAVRGKISLRVPGRSGYQVDVLDLSTNGCKLELVERPSIGSSMFVKFESLEVIGASVVWVDAHVAGLKFDRPLHPAVLDLLLLRLGAG